MKKASGMGRSSYLTDNERNDKSIENLNKEYVKDCFIYSAVVHCAKIRQYHQHHHQHQKEMQGRWKISYSFCFFTFFYRSFLIIELFNEWMDCLLKWKWITWRKRRRKMWKCELKYFLFSFSCRRYKKSFIYIIHRFKDF